MRLKDFLTNGKIFRASSQNRELLLFLGIFLGERDFARKPKKDLENPRVTF